MAARRFLSHALVCAQLAIGANLLPAPPAPHPAPAPSETPFPNPEFVAFNRYGVTGIGDEGVKLAISEEGNGLIPFEARGEKASYRFTFVDSEATRRLREIALFYEATGTPKANSLGIRIRANDAATGEPGKILAAFVATPHETAAGDPRWHTIPLPEPYPALISRQVYHLELEMLLVPPGTLAFYSARQRHPVPYMPFEAGSSDPKSPYDEELAILVDRDASQGGCGYLLKDDHPSYVPVFLLRHTGAGEADHRLFGNPFDRKQALPDAYTVFGSQTFGQRIRLSAGITFDHVAFMTGQSEPGPQKPNGDLLVEIYGPGCDGDPELFASSVLIEGVGGSGFASATGRWHWYGAYLPGPVAFAADTDYYLMLSSPGSSGGAQAPWDQWTLPADYSDYASSLSLPTFMGTDSCVVQAVRSTCASSPGTAVLTGIDVKHAGNADCAFILSSIATASGPRPVNMQDETSGSSPSFACKAVAAEGEVLSITPVARNIGGSGPPGTLFVRLVEQVSGTAEATVGEVALQGLPDGACTACPYAPNSDIFDAWTGSCVCPQPQFASLPFTPFPVASTHTYRRFYLEFGWEDPAGGETIDDRVPFEVRKDATCSPCGCECQDP